MTIAFLILLYVLKCVGAILPKKPEIDTTAKRSVRFVIALLWPLLAMAKVFIWNTWASHWIGWPQITTLEQYLVTFFFL